MTKVWIIGGTVETYTISKKLLKNNIDIIISVATDYGYEEFIEFKDFLIKGRMDRDMMIDFCINNNINCIADVSHPYAKEVSSNAMEVANILNIKYYRFERIDDDIIYKENIYYVNSHIEAVKLIKKLGFKRIFSTIGINNIDTYIDAKFDELFIRILPRSEQIAYLEKKTYKPKNIIAMQGPFTIKMNIETLRHVNADVMVTKDSGKEGGYDDKIKACLEAKIPVIVVKRPDIEYKNKFNDINLMIEKIILGDD